jgi:hypothetical protein
MAIAAFPFYLNMPPCSRSLIYEPIGSFTEDHPAPLTSEDSAMTNIIRPASSPCGHIPAAVLEIWRLTPGVPADLE